MFLNKTLNCIKVFKKKKKNYKIFVNVRQNFIFSGIMSDRFWKIICSPGYMLC